MTLAARTLMAETPAADPAPLAAAEAVAKSYAVGRGGLLRRPASFRAVDGVTLTVACCETVGLVGESGCGKSTLAKLMLGLERPDEGRAVFDGADLAAMDEAEWRRSRTRMQPVFQDAGGSLDPRLSARDQVREPLDIHDVGDAAARAARVDEVFEAVRLGPHLRDRYPHELSGGQLQRVVIARALALGPDLLALDEPISALDVSIQAQILNLLRALRDEMRLAYLFVSHDLGVVRHVADRVAVMYLGRIVETAPTRALFDGPRHPYTRALLASAPIPDPGRRGRAAPLRGDPPSPQNPPAGCRFHPRCPHAVERCRAEAPALRPFSGGEVACWRAEEIT